MLTLQHGPSFVIEIFIEYQSRGAPIIYVCIRFSNLTLNYVTYY